MANWTKLFRSMAQAQFKNHVEDRKLANYLATMERERRTASMSHYKDILAEREFAAKCKRDADNLARKEGLKKRKKTKHNVQQITLRPIGGTPQHSRGSGGFVMTNAEPQKLQKVRRRLGEHLRQTRGIGRRLPKTRHRVTKMNLHNKPPLSLPTIPEGRTTFITEGSLPQRLPGDQQPEATTLPPDNVNLSSGDETNLPLLVPPGEVTGHKREVRIHYSHRRNFSKISTFVLSPIDETKVSEEQRTQATVNLPPVHRDSPTPTQSKTNDIAFGEEIVDSDQVSATSLPPINLRNRASDEAEFESSTSLPEATTTTQMYGSTVRTITVETMRAVDAPGYGREISRDFNLPPLVVPDHRKFAFSDTRTSRRPDVRLQPKRSSWTDFWIGDPNAIGSVRRARVAPEQLSQRSWAKAVKFKQILMADEERYQASRRQLPLSLPQLR